MNFRFRTFSFDQIVDCRARKDLSRNVWVVPSKMLTDFEMNAKKYPRPHWGMCYQLLGMFLLQAREVAGQSNLQEANTIGANITKSVLSFQGTMVHESTVPLDM